MKKTVITILITFVLVSGVAVSDYVINKDFAVVKTKPVTVGNVKRYIKASGIVKEQNKREINVEIPFTVAEVYTEAGAEISKGQKLFKLNKEILKSKIEFENLKGHTEDTANIIAKINNYDSYVTSPINGVVTKINGRIGSEININEPLVIISDLDNLIIKAQIQENLICDVYEGQPVIISGRSFNKETEGKVIRISPVVEETETNSGAYVTVDIKADSYDGIKPGSYVDVKLEKENKKETITIPFDCVLFDEENPYVFINRYGYAVKRYVNLGEEYEIDVEILSGLKEDDKLILNPKIQELNEGDKLSD